MTDIAKCGCHEKDEEIAKLKEEAKLGNIPYREAIALMEENAKLKEAVDRYEHFLKREDIWVTKFN